MCVPLVLRLALRQTRHPTHNQHQQLHLAPKQSQRTCSGTAVCCDKALHQNIAGHCHQAVPIDMQQAVAVVLPLMLVVWQSLAQQMPLPWRPRSASSTWALAALGWALALSMMRIRLREQGMVAQPQMVRQQRVLVPAADGGAGKSGQASPASARAAAEARVDVIDPGAATRRQAQELEQVLEQTHMIWIIGMVTMPATS